MGDQTIDIQGVETGDWLYCTIWEGVQVTYPKCLSEEQVIALMEKHPILAEIIEDECDIEIEGGMFRGVSVGMTADLIPFSQFDEDHTFDYRDFDNFKSDSGWDGEDKVILVDGFTFHISLTGCYYTNIGFE